MHAQSLIVRFKILFDKRPYNNAPTDMVVIGCINRGVLPAQIDELQSPDHIKDIFKQCWVAHPDDRIGMTLCSQGVADALTQLPIG